MWDCENNQNYCTTLCGKYVCIQDECSEINECSDNCTIDFGGENGQHNCEILLGGITVIYI